MTYKFVDTRGPQPWQLKGETWRETQVRYDDYRHMDLASAQDALREANLYAQGVTHVELPNGNMMPLFPVDVDEIVKRLLSGSHSGRAGVRRETD